MKRSILFALSLLLSFSLAQGIITTPSNDPEMLAAEHRAQEKLGVFIVFLRVPPPPMIYFSVKVRFEYDGGGEHMWLENLNFDLGAEEFTGTLGNQPEYVKNLKRGDTVTVHRSKVTDWMIVERSQDGYRLLGGYSIRVLRSRMNETERAQYDRRLGLIVDERGLF